ncbi:MAG TPA: hypothetical protein VGQ05_12615 [Streptosporangiaceae bacterium]|nr:hypothetical protein [Streptosporangiaceae bacterium]
MADRTRRGVLAAAASLPLLAVSGCKGVGALAPPPRPRPDVTVLRAAIAAEEAMIAGYGTAIARFPGLAATLTGLRAEHRLHLAELRNRLVIPPGSPYRSSFASPSPRPAGSPGAAAVLPAGQAAALDFLQTAEDSAAAALLRGLPAVSSSLAQLLASVAASESTHVAVLQSAAG